MELTRSAGILLHPGSLPSDYCIGELGSSAFRFIDYLVQCEVSLWQVLPLGPTGSGNSPYAALSAFAGNPFLVSLEKLKSDGYLTEEDLSTYPGADPGRVDYNLVSSWKVPLLEKAAQKFLDTASEDEQKNFTNFGIENSEWLNDFSLFVVIKEHYDRKAEKEKVSDSRWNYYWDKKIILKEKKTELKWIQKYKNEIEIKKVLQYFFYSQWISLKKYANARGIKIIGDIPIYVAACSSDLWSNRKMFHVDNNGHQTVVAGVPPDYFSKTGQLWGNPIYKWDEHEAEGFLWWTKRIQGMLKLVDIVRIDHFIGLEAYWEVPADAPTAETGRWVKAPGKKLFKALQNKLGPLPFIAEDLGVLTPEVEELRDSFNFPGMKILQFAFTIDDKGKQDSKNIFLPFTYSKNTVVYTGTHDNDTTRGWYNSISDRERDLVRRYLGRPDDDIVWDLIREALSSVSDYAIIPMQDILNLDTESRMNTPSTLKEENWSWRMSNADMADFTAARLKGMIELYGR
ncbi:MAG: 4-alpha-glucanotransferase [Spirochaetaceae bacterium]|nr:4-alpha-glucanotransferase [Spirochaetaceae bacterium]